MVRQITHKRSFTTWLWLMLDRAPVFITTMLPTILILLNMTLDALGKAHANVGWQTSALAFALAGGRLLREGLTNGKIVAGLNQAKREYGDFLNSSHQAVPVGPPPGAPAPDAPLAGGAEGTSVRGY